MKRGGKSSKMRSEIAEVVLNAALPHLTGWIETLGEMGRPDRKGDKNPAPATVRVQAARVGVEFVTKFLGDADLSAEGEDLLRDLEKLSTTAERGEQVTTEGDNGNRDSTTPVGATGRSWPENADMGS